LCGSFDQEGAVEIHEHTENGILIMRIESQIDSTTGPVLGDRLKEIIGKGQQHLILDLSAVPYISSAGLRVLSIALKSVRAPSVGGDLYLANLSKTVAHAFRISGFDQVFHTYETVSEAMAAMIASREFEAGE
jgi:anti-anti-sigma factor